MSNLRAITITYHAWLKMKIILLFGKYLGALSSSGYLSGSSGLPSLESSQDAANFQSNVGSLVLSGSDLGSSICHTPGGSTPGSWKLPEKLQIVKPLEGSSTLQVWSALATPHLGNLLEKRPGVQMRVERPVGEIGMQVMQSFFVCSGNHTKIIIAQTNIFSKVGIYSSLYRKTSNQCRIHKTEIF